MSYNSAIPIGTDAMIVSQPQIRANYQSINTVWAQNHVNLTGIQNQGMHKALTFRELKDAANNPLDPTTSATQLALYTKAVNYSGNPQPCLFFMPSSTQTPIQMTYPSIIAGLNTATPPTFPLNQYSFTAGPFVIFGGFLDNINDNHLVNLPVSTTLIYAQVTCLGTQYQGTGPVFGYAAIAVISGASFTVRFSKPQIPPPTTSFFYFAVGI